MNENTANKTLAKDGYVIAYAMGGGTVGHIIPRYGNGWNEYKATAICGTTPRARWAGNHGWTTAGHDDTYATPAEAAAARNNVCKRCSAAVSKYPAPAEAAAPEVTPAPAKAEAAALIYTVTTYGPSPRFATLGPVIDTRVLTAAEAARMRGRYPNLDAAKDEAARLDMGRFDGSCTGWDRQSYSFERGHVMIDISEAEAPAPVAVDESDPATWTEGGGYTWETPCSACSDGEYHYTRVSDGHCISCDRYAEDAPKFSVGQTATFDGYRTGTILALEPNAVTGESLARVESHPYGNKMWFDVAVLAPAEAPAPARYSVPGRVSPAVIVAAKDLQPGTAVTGYLGSDPVTAVSAVAPHEGGGTEITWTTAGGNTFSEVVSNDHGVYTVPAAEAEDAPARGSHWAMEYPALNGGIVMQGHADYCSAHGHATHTNDGDISPWCPRCGAKINADTVTDVAMARALELAAMAAPGAHRVDTGRKASDIFGRIPLRRNGRDAFTGAMATVITYFQGGPGRGECVDAVIVAASGGANQPQRVDAAHDALERLQGRVSGNITAGQYQTIATGPGGGVLFIFGTWENEE